MIILKDIAQMAGVNISTVSRALNDSNEVSDEKKQEIRNIAASLNYTPNYYAKALAGKETKTVGVIVPEISSNYYATMIGAIEMGLQDHGYSLIIGMSHHEWKLENHYLNVFWNRKVDGILIAGSMHNEITPTINRIHSDNIPIVLIHSFIDYQNYDYVAIDDSYGIGQAIQLFKKQGHRHIGYIASELASRFRLQILKKIIHDNGLILNEKHIKIGKEANEYCGYKYMKELINEGDMPTASLAAYDDIAVGAMRALYEYKYRVPEDISIIGYDNIRQSAFLRCPLTTISPPVEKMAKICLDILFQKIEDKNLKTIQHISLNSELIIRESTTKINLGE